MVQSLTLRGTRTLLAAALFSVLLVACGTPAEPAADSLPPVVNAGADQIVDEGAAVSLLATADDAGATVSWQQTAGPDVTLTGADSLSAGFTAPSVNALAILGFRVTVTNAAGLKASDEVSVTVRDLPASNRTPIVNAGADQSVSEGAAVTLSGSASDEDGRVVSLRWTQTAGPSVALQNADQSSASFTAPAVSAATVLSFRLTATDEAGATGSDEINVTVQDVAAPNRVPVADAGPDQDVQEGATAQLLGSGLDDDGTISGFQWRQIAGPNVTLSDATAARPSFTAPQVTADTQLQFELKVRDDRGAESAADTVTVTVRDRPQANQPPVVGAGADISVDEGAEVTLSGTASDADGTVVSVAWTQLSGATATLTGADTLSVQFTAPQVAANDTLVFQLSATDDKGATASDTVTVQVKNLTVGNQPPAANAGPDQTVNEGAVVILAGSGADSDGTIASFAWSQTAGDPVSLSGAATATASFTAPQVDADKALTFSLTVTDNQGATATDTVQVSVRDLGVVAAACTADKLCAGTAKRSIAPSDAHIAGVDESRLGGQTVKQRFHLGGFGFGPFDAFGPFNDFIANDAAKRATHCKGLLPSCDDDQRELTWVRAFYLSQPAAGGRGTETLFVTLDAVGAGNVIQQTLTEAIAAETGVPVANIMVGHTHTHAGADLQGLWGGVPQDWVQNVLRVQAVSAAKEALLNARAADVTYAAGRDSAFNNYRRPRQTDPDADSDDQLAVVQARDSLGAVLGTLVQYTAHPTAIGTGAGGALGRVPHPDYPLGLEDTLETAFGATAVYYNGPIADASGAGPTTGSNDYDRVYSRGECLAKSVLTLLNPDEPQQCSFSLLKPAEVRKVQLAPTLSVRHQTAILPVTNPLFLGVAAAGAFNRYYDFTQLPLAQIPGIGPELAAEQTNLPQLAPTAITAVSRITIGGEDAGVDIVTIPGETTNTFGQYIRGLGKSKNMMLMGLTQNAFGYIIPEEEFSYIDAGGGSGFVVPGTGYEEFVSLGPLTAPLLRVQAYNPLFDIGPADERNLPPSLTACADAPGSRQCLLSETLFRVDYIQRSYAAACRENFPDQAESFCALLDPDTPLAGPCRDAGGPEALCSALGAGNGGGGAGAADASLIQPALDALLRGCDVLDTSNCLYPFPNDYFTVAASTDSPQSLAKGGTGKRVQFSMAAMPRNSAGKPVDPEEWNRNDGFSPGALITTFVPNLSLEKTYALPSDQIGVANLGLSLNAAAPILLLEVPQVPEAATPRPQLAWAEIDANAGLLLPNAAPLAGELPFDPINNPAGGKAALLIRPGKNLQEGRRYVVVLRSLKNADGEALPPQAGFAACRSAAPSALPPVASRCAALQRDVFPVLDAAGIAQDESLYLAWDFTVASTNNQIGRLREMRDDAFRTLATADGADCTRPDQGTACKAPAYTVDKITNNPQTGIARRIEGTITVPSYLVPADATPLEDARLSAALDAFCAGLPASAPQELRNGCNDFRDAGGILQGLATPPNRLNYTPAAANPCAGLSPEQMPSSGCANQLRYGDGLPDRNGTLSSRYMCQIPARATPDTPARAGVYGHGLLDSRVAVTYDGVPDLSREHNYLFCAVDFYGFATGDLVNVASSLVDLSNFAVIPDASQQGIVNFAFLARLLRDPAGFASNAAFQQDGKPVFDPSAVFYDGNSQGGILGGVVMAASKDIQRGALGSLGMNYSTLLTRSTDFDEYALPLYASYTDPLDRQLAFSLIQMLWDRSENNGYAAHLTDNSAFGGEPKIVKLDPQFGDHQVTMWSAEVMARTMGVPFNASQTARVAGKLGQARRHPDVMPYLGLQPLNFSDATQASAGAMVVWDDERTLIPPIDNTPPRAGRDPHDDSAKKPSGRCQKAHFLRKNGQLVDVTAMEFDGAVCAAVPPAGDAPADADGDGVPDSRDRCASTPQGGVVDANGCTAEQAAADDDGDGVANLNDACPATPTDDDPDAQGCGASQRDSDGDGVNDGADLCPGTPAGSTVSASGCPITTNASCASGQNLAGNRSYQVTIPSASGETISFQVLEPRTFDCSHRAEGAHPLILHGHGFGGARSTSGFAEYRDRGYTVISIDLRGFGGSTGTVRVMDPDFEGRDLVGILDWAEQNLDYLAWRDESPMLMKPFVARPASAQSVAGGPNLVVGSTGSSYGGGYQLLLQNVDAKSRLDAMAPDITWHDLRWSLNPGDVIKTGWDLLLVAGGEAGSYAPGLQNFEPPTQRGLDPYIVETLARASASGEFPREALEWFRYHSPSYWCGLNDQPTMPYALGEPIFDANFMLTGFLQDAPGGNTRQGQAGIPVLLSQGMRDTLFNFNDAWWNYQCMATRGDDVRLITHQSGHILNSFVSAPGPLNFGNTGGNNDCGTRKRGDATVQWFNEKLKGSGPASILAGTEDALCVSLADGDAVDIPVEKFLAPHADNFARPLTASWTNFNNVTASNVPQGVAAQQLHLAGQSQPGIVPLLTVTGGNGLLLAGIPQAAITVSTPQLANDLACAQGQLPTLRSGCDSIVFVGLGVKKAGAADHVLVDDQLLPVRGLGTHADLSLVGVAERLGTGDSLALMVYGYSPQYPVSFSRDASIPAVTVTASLQLPLYGVAANGKPDFALDVATQVQTDGGTPPAGGGEGLQGVLDGLMGTTADFLAALAAGDAQAALAILQAGGNEAADGTLQVLAGNAGSALGLALPPPAQAADPVLPAPLPLMAGIAKGSVRIPVGTPLGGYLRPPVGGDYLPGLEAFAGGDPSKFFAELVDFLPTEQDHDGLPLAPLPDELRAVHSPYATYSPPSRGYYDSLIAKAVALYDGNDYVVLVKTDFIGMLDELVQGVADKVQAETISAEHPNGIDLHDGLLMSATHSHDGPGAVGNHSIRYFWLAIDAYQPEVYARAVDDLAKVVKRAVLNLQPAKIGHAMGREGFVHPVKGATQLNGFRRSLLPSYSQAANDDVRRRLGVLRIDKADGTPLAVVMNFAVHGIAFDVENQYFSGDVPGAMERATEQKLNVPLAMLVQNTGGNISPRGVDNDNKLQRIESFGELFAPQVQTIYQNISNFQTAPDLRTISQRIILSRERLGYEAGEYPYAWGAAQCGNDIEVPFVGGGVNDIPGYGQTGLPTKFPQCVPATPPDAIDLADNGVGENGALVPQDTRMTAAKIGSITLLAQPGEPLTEYGVRLLDIAGAEGYQRDDTFIWGYAQDHVGYILAPEKDDWAMGGTEGTTTFWGWKQGQRLLDVNRDLLIALRDGKAAPADEFQINYFYDQIYDQQPGAPVIPSPRPGRLVSEVSDIARFETTRFVWEGGDPVIDSPEVRLEQQVAGNWQPVRRGNGEIIDSLSEMHLQYRLVSGAHLWTLVFEAPRDWPAGSYRFAVSGTARQASDAPYALNSAAFVVSPSASLQLSDPVVAGNAVEVTLAYTPRPDNYRVIDALLPGDKPAPVRQGRVRFDNGSSVVEDAEPEIIVRNGQLLAVYRANISGSVQVSGVDAWGNSTGTAAAPPPAAAGANRGTGLLGVLAEFVASLHQAVVALASLDPATAFEQLQLAFTELADALVDRLSGDENSLAALLQHLGENLAAGDPQGAASQAGRDAGGFAGLDTDPVSAAQRAASAAREVEAVVITGAQLPDWSAPSAVGSPYPYPSGATITGQLFDPTPVPGQVRDAHNGVFIHPAGWTPGDQPTQGGVPVDEIAAYAYSNNSWREIPVQVDEMYPYFLANNRSDFSVYSGTDEELSYAWDLERWKPNDSADGCSAVPPVGTPDPIAGLDNDDELVFMAKDAGSMAPAGALPPDVPAGSAGQLINVADPLNPASTRVVYLYQKPGGSSFRAQQHYVRYTRDLNADQWIDRSFFADNDPEKLGSSNTGYGANLSGTVCHPTQGKKQSTDRFPRDGVTVQTDTYVWKASGRWMIREIGIAKPDGSGNYGEDLIDRWKGRAFQQSPDSTISLVGFEDEQVNWEANSSLLGERCGPVRCMREVWGADSGTNVTKTEIFYRDFVISRYHVRVHPIPPDGLYTSWDYNRGAMVPSPSEQAAGVPGGRYYTVLRPQGVPIDGVNDDIGQIDSVAPIAGFCLTSDGPQPQQNGRCPLFLDAADPTFNLPLAFANWEQVSAKGDLGSMVYTFELKGATSLATPAVVPYYRDDACLDDGTGDDPVKRPYPGETSTDPRVQAGYAALAGKPYEALACEEKQGVYAAHGIHYFATGDVDNAFVLGKPINEIDGQQWQFMVPTEKPKNVGEPYANVARVPLKAVAVPLSAPALPRP